MTEPATTEPVTAEPVTEDRESPDPTEISESEAMPVTLAVVGPTAAGKSGLGLELARRLDGEIVNGDALQAYRLLSIGTDKPTPEMLAEIPHHLVDILDPDEVFSAGEFARRARRAIKEIHAAGRVAIVVGGSGLYQRALFEGLSPLPKSDPEIREELAQRTEKEGLASLYAELREVDPETWARLNPTDPQRILRALEIYRTSGVTMTEWLRKKPLEKPLPVFRIGLTVPRGILYDRIGDRVEQMVERGWVSEVVNLLDRGIEPAAPAFQAIGYRQMVQHVRGDCTLEEAVRDTVQSTRRYAKRQMTWFRKESGVRWVPGLELDTAFFPLLHEIQCMKLRLEERSLNEQA